MKKVSLVLACAIFLTIVPTVYGISNYNIMDFTGMTQGTDINTDGINGIQLSNVPTNGSVTIDEIPSYGVNALKLSDTNSASGGVGVTYSLSTNVESLCVVEAEVVTDSTLYLECLTENGKAVGRLLFRNEGDIYINEASVKNTPVNGYAYKAAGQCYNIRFVFDMSARTYDLYVTSDDFASLTRVSDGAELDGKTFIRRAIPFNADCNGESNIGKVRFNKSHGYGTSYVKFIKTMQYDEPVVTDIYAFDTDGNEYIPDDFMPANIARVDVYFDCEDGVVMDSKTFSGIKLCQNNIPETPSKVEYDETNNKCSLYFDADIQPDKAYKLIIDENVADVMGLKVNGYSETTFYVNTADIEWTNCTYKINGTAGSLNALAAGDIVTADITLKNNTAGNETFILVMAYYDSDVLKGLSYNTVSLTAHTPLPAATEEIVIPQGFNAANASIETYIWKSTGEIKPICALNAME